MPIKAKQVAYTYSADELKEMLITQIKADHPKAKRVEVAFTLGTVSDYMDRDSYSVFKSVTITVHEE